MKKIYYILVYLSIVVQKCQKLIKISKSSHTVKETGVRVECTEGIPLGAPVPPRQPTDEQRNKLRRNRARVREVETSPRSSNCRLSVTDLELNTVDTELLEKKKRFRMTFQVKIFSSSSKLYAMCCLC